MAYKEQNLKLDAVKADLETKLAGQMAQSQALMEKTLLLERHYKKAMKEVME